MATDSPLSHTETPPSHDQVVESPAPQPDAPDPSAQEDASRNELAELLNRKATNNALNSIVLGRYKILDILGRGAFSVVYRASQVGIGRVVALKVFRLHKSTRSNTELAETALGRFQREARLASILRHPNTITLFDYDKTEQGVVYMAFEFVDGPTITELIKSNPNGLSPARVIDIARQIALSLQEAHEVGIIHRDLKPGNIMLAQSARGEEIVKVLDFGIAKMIEGTPADPEYTPDHTDELSMLDFENLVDDESINLTHEGRIVGTPRYIPPEQIHGRELTGAADLYSLGLIMLELLTGLPANPGKKAAELIKWHLKNKPPQLPDGFVVPDGLNDIITKTTQRAVNERYPDCASLLADLDQLDDSGEWRQDPPPERNPWPLIIAANVVVLIIIVAALAFWLTQRPDTYQPPPQTTSGTNAIVTPPSTDTTPPATSPDAASPETTPSRQPETTGASASPDEGADAPAAEPDAGDAEERSFRLTTTPPGASLFLNDSYAGPTPFEIPLKPDQPTRALIRKKGYVPVHLKLTPDTLPALPIVLMKRGPGARPNPGGATDPPKEKPDNNAKTNDGKSNTSGYRILN